MRISLSKFVALCAAAVALSSSALPCYAASLFDVTAHARIRAIDTGPNALSPGNASIVDALGLTLGADLFSTYIVDVEAPAQIDDDMGIQYFVYDAIARSLATSPGGVFESDQGRPSGIVILDNEPGGADIMSMVSRGAVLTDIGPIDFRLILGLYDDNGEALVSSNLDLSVFNDLSQWGDGLTTGLLLTLSFPNGEFANVNAEFVSVAVTPVPLPAGCVFFASALVALARRWR